MRNKKNQHFLPKLYLRNYSIENNKKQIGIYNLSNKIYSLKAPIKSQGSKDYYYGLDGVIEDGLASIENSLAPSLRKLIINGLPSKKSPEYYSLMYFLVLTDLRNPSAINYAKQQKVELRKKLKELHPDGNFEKELFEDVSHEQAIYLALSQVNKTVPMLSDLNCKLLINNTDSSFITSDNPVIKYNQYLEQRKYWGGKTGYGCVGLQVFLPISSNIILLFYDSDIYKIGDKRKNFLNINQTNDVDQLNILQLVNCSNILYFNENISHSYIEMIAYRAKSYKKANILEPNVLKSFDYGNEGSHYISSGTTDCEIKLNVPGIKLRSGVNHIPLSRNYAYLRPKPKLLHQTSQEKHYKQPK